MANERRERAIETAAAAGGIVADPLWYKDAVIYELHVKAFYDANNDGIGDFAGLMRRLDYLQDLGVTALWLLPFYPSPLKDDGYDIADYRGVHPDYGTRAEFRQFVREAHRRNLHVITELVVNHTSDQHPWFQAARRAPAGSSKRNFYVWSDSDRRYAGTRVIFNDTESSNWTWDAEAKAYSCRGAVGCERAMTKANFRGLNETGAIVGVGIDSVVTAACRVQRLAVRGPHQANVRIHLLDDLL